MGYSKTFYEYREKMKTEVVKEGIKKLEDHFNNTVADIVVAHCEDNQGPRNLRRALGNGY
uniref:Uncharacterized protein n=1 Tax=Pipistrellus kuhlii TaxID=59472 RepID=A0A7J7YX22_PIPKU|nr:hypothetical protein mPipKuh1_009941 [Pipistrellus kuhlii]